MSSHIIMKEASYLVICVLAIGTLCSCANEPVMEPAIFKGANATEMEKDLIRTVNDHRSRSGQVPLSFDEVAYRYANGHTDHMISEGSLNHDGFEIRASGLAREAGAEAVGENVATGYKTAQDAFANWYSSADHRKTMEGDFTHTAASIKKDGKGNLYYTQLFYR